MRIPILLCTLLFLCSCGPAKNMQTIQIINAQEFNVLVKRMSEELRAMGIIDEANAWYEPMISSSFSSAGEELYENLTLSFLSSANDITHASFLKDGTGSRLEIKATAFRLMRGEDRITVDLIAVLDWNMDDEEDWLVRYSLEPERAKRASRYYYLVITDVEARPMYAEVIAMKDAFDGSFKVFQNTNETNSFTSEFDAGTFSVLEKPQAPVELKSTKISADKNTIEERTLLE